MVLLALNIFAANLADRGAAIDPIDVVYPYATNGERQSKLLATSAGLRKFL